MTDKKTAARKSLLDAVRRLERSFETTDAAAPSTTMLYLGSPLFQGSIDEDAREWLRALTPALSNLDPAQRLFHYLKVLVVGPDATTALTCVEAAWELVRGPFEAELSRAERSVITDAYARCAYYAWCQGSPEAALHVAQAAYQFSRQATVALYRVRHTVTALAALRTAAEDYPWDTFEPSRERAKALNRLVDVGALAQEVRLAQHAALAEQVLADPKAADRQVLEHVKGQLSKLPRVADLDDREGLVRLDELEVEPAPGVVVVIESLDHLPPTRTGPSPRAEFEALAGRHVPLAQIPDLTEASAVLRGEFPWAAEAVDRLLGSLVGRHSMPPTLLHGAPGVAKNELARRAAEVLGLPLTEYACAGASDAAFAGTSRQWHSGRASVPLQAIRRTGIANPVILLDEIEKAGTSRHNGNLQDSLLALLDGRKAFFDLYVEAPVDLSAVSFIATANDLSLLRGSPLADRFAKVEVPSPGPEHMDAIVSGILRRLREESDLDPRWIPALDASEREVIARAWRGGSIRPLRRAVERLLALRHDRGFAH